MATEAVDSFVDAWRPRTNELADPVVLADALLAMEELESKKGLYDEIQYISLRSAVDSNNPKVQAAESKAQQFYMDIGNKLEFFWLAIGTIPKDRHKDILAHERIAPFKHLVEQRFANAKYQLSEAEEKILNLKSVPAYQRWVQMTEVAMAKDTRTALTESGEERKLTQEELMGAFRSSDARVRDSAAQAFNEQLADYAEMATAELNAVLANKQIDDKLRGFTRPDESRLVGDDISAQFVDGLLEAVADRSQLAHHYYELKAKIMGQDKLKYHERVTPIAATDVKISFEEGVKTVHTAFAALDQEFADTLKNNIDAGQVDVYPRAGKRGGAFCAYGAFPHPVYVMLNWKDSLNDVGTLAHEFGHAINAQYLKQSESPLTCDNPMATAEVASTFMEAVVMDHLMASSDDETSYALLAASIEDAIATIFRQLACYRFELALHDAYREEGYLSTERIGALFTEHMQAYMGPSVEQSEGSQNWWTYWSHIRNYFYVYSYASGQLIAMALKTMVDDEPSKIEALKGFLRVGRSKSPAAVFADLGIDIEDKAFWSGGLDQLEVQLDRFEELARRLGKL